MPAEPAAGQPAEVGHAGHKLLSSCCSSLAHPAELVAQAASKKVGFSALPAELVERISRAPGLSLQDRLSLEGTSRLLRGILRAAAWTVELPRAEGDAARLAAMAAWAARRRVSQLTLGPAPEEELFEAIAAPGFVLSALNGLTGLEALTLHTLGRDEPQGFQCGTLLTSLRLQRWCDCSLWEVDGLLAPLQNLRALAITGSGVSWSAARLPVLPRLEALRCTHDTLEVVASAQYPSLTRLELVGTSNGYTPQRVHELSYLPPQLRALTVERVSVETPFLHLVPLLESYAVQVYSTAGENGTLHGLDGLTGLTAFSCTTKWYGGEAFTLPTGLRALRLHAAMRGGYSTDQGPAPEWLARLSRLTRLELLLATEKPAYTIPAPFTPAVGQTSDNVLGLLGEPLPAQLQQLEVLWPSTWAYDPRLVARCCRCPGLRRLKVHVTNYSGSKNNKDPDGSMARLEGQWEGARAQLEAAGVGLDLHMDRLHFGPLHPSYY